MAGTEVEALLIRAGLPHFSSDIEVDIVDLEAQALRIAKARDDRLDHQLFRLQQSIRQKMSLNRHIV